MNAKVLSNDKVMVLEDDPASAPRRAWYAQGGWWLRAAVSVGVLGWLIFETKWEPILQTLADVRLEFCLASLLVYCVSQAISSLRWQILARSLGFHQPLGRFVALYYVGMFFNLFLPTSIGGDVVRAWMLAERKGRRWLSALSVFSERLSGLLALLIIACVATMVNQTHTPEWASATVWLTAAAGFSGLLALPLLSRFHEKLRALAQGLSFYRGHMGRWLTALLISFVVQALSITQTWLLGQALDLPTPFLTYAVVVPLVSLLTMLPISVNGVGVREASLVLLLAPSGVAQAEAVALGVLSFCVLAAASALGGIVYVSGRSSRTEGETNGLVRRDSHQGRKGQPAAVAPTVAASARSAAD